MRFSLVAVSLLSIAGVSACASSGTPASEAGMLAICNKHTTKPYVATGAHSSTVGALLAAGAQENQNHPVLARRDSGTPVTVCDVALSQDAPAKYTAVPPGLQLVVFDDGSTTWAALPATQ